MSDSCNCIADIDAKLDGQCLNATMLEQPRRVIIDLVRTDKYVAENRRGKARFIVASHCPFCGVKYQNDAALSKAGVK